MSAVSKRARWVAVGAAVGWLFDAERGRARRAKLRQLALRARDEARGLIELGLGKLPEPARTRANRATTSVLGAPPADRALTERLRREVLAPAGAQHLRVQSAGGHVLVEGDMPSADAAERVTQQLRDAPDVVELSVRIDTPDGLLRTERTTA